MIRLIILELNTVPGFEQIEKIYWAEPFKQAYQNSMRYL